MSSITHDEAKQAPSESSATREAHGPAFTAATVRCIARQQSKDFPVVTQSLLSSTVTSSEQQHVVYGQEEKMDNKFFGTLNIRAGAGILPVVTLVRTCQCCHSGNKVNQDGEMNTKNVCSNNNTCRRDILVVTPLVADIAWVPSTLTLDIKFVTLRKRATSPSYTCQISLPGTANVDTEKDESAAAAALHAFQVLASNWPLFCLRTQRIRFKGASLTLSPRFKACGRLVPWIGGGRKHIRFVYRGRNPLAAPDTSIVTRGAGGGGVPSSSSTSVAVTSSQSSSSTTSGTAATSTAVVGKHGASIHNTHMVIARGRRRTCSCEDVLINIATSTSAKRVSAHHQRSSSAISSAKQRGASSPSSSISMIPPWGRDKASIVLVAEGEKRLTLAPSTTSTNTKKQIESGDANDNNHIDSSSRGSAHTLGFRGSWNTRVVRPASCPPAHTTLDDRSSSIFTSPVTDAAIIPSRHETAATTTAEVILPIHSLSKKEKSKSNNKSNNKSNSNTTPNKKDVPSFVVDGISPPSLPLLPILGASLTDSSPPPPLPESMQKLLAKAAKVAVQHALQSNHGSMIISESDNSKNNSSVPSKLSQQQLVVEVSNLPTKKSKPRLQQPVTAVSPHHHHHRTQSDNSSTRGGGGPSSDRGGASQDMGSSSYSVSPSSVNNHHHHHHQEQHHHPSGGNTTNNSFSSSVTLSGNNDSSSIVGNNNNGTIANIAHSKINEQQQHQQQQYAAAAYSHMHNSPTAGTMPPYFAVNSNHYYHMQQHQMQCPQMPPPLPTGGNGNVSVSIPSKVLHVVPPSAIMTSGSSSSSSSVSTPSLSSTAVNAHGLGHQNVSSAANTVTVAAPIMYHYVPSSATAEISQPYYYPQSDPRQQQQQQPPPPPQQQYYYVPVFTSHAQNTSAPVYYMAPSAATTMPQTGDVVVATGSSSTNGISNAFLSPVGGGTTPTPSSAVAAMYQQQHLQQQMQYFQAYQQQQPQQQQQYYYYYQPQASQYQ